MESSRNSRAAVGPVGLLLLILGMIFGTRIPSGPGKGEEKSGRAGEGSSAGKSGESKSEGTSGPDFVQPYEAFRFGLAGAKEIDRCLAPAPASERLGKLLAQDASQGHICPDFLIVTLPDPIDSRVGYMFDTIQDAVQMAVEARGWDLDRFWLPWLPSGGPLRAGADLKPVEVPGTPLQTPLHERQPGLMLFRKLKQADQPQPLLFVFLVGETPTRGVAKAALIESVETIRVYFRESSQKACRSIDAIGANLRESVLDLCQSGASKRIAPSLVGLIDLLSQLMTELVTCRSIDVRILGPYFSGSQDSVQHVVQSLLQGPAARKGPPLHFRFRSGSADRVDAVTFRQAGVEFDATVLPFDAVMIELCKYLKDKEGVDLDKVALLTESDTTFGQFNNEKIGSNSGKNWFETIKECTGVTLTQMKFPFHISQLAAATRTIDQSASQGSADLVRPSSRMTIPFGDPSAPRDAVPSLAPQMSNVTSEFVLSKIFETISRERFRYIGIVATDPRDTIFLASQIRVYCPDAQLFTVGGDIMLSHPQFSQQLGGMLVGSCYPLFSMAQRWDQPLHKPDRRHQFASQEEEGVYNAAFSLLGSDDLERLYDYAPPFEEMKGLDDLGVKPHQVNSNTCPGVWLSAVGARGLWPVRFVEMGFDLELVCWGDASTVRTSAKSLVIVGTDYRGLIRVRIFDHDRKCTDWVEQPEMHANAISSLKQKISSLKQKITGLLPRKDRLTSAEKKQVISEAISISMVDPPPQVLSAAKCNSYTFRTPVSPERSGEVDQKAEMSTRQFLALVPETTWVWCTLVLGLSVVVWALYLSQKLLAWNKWDQTKSSCSCWSRYLRPIRKDPAPDSETTSEGGTAAVRHNWRLEFLIALGLLALTFTYSYVVLLPCWVAWSYTPWPMLLQAISIWETPPHDRFNLISLVAVSSLGAVTFLALAVTMVRRIWHVLLWPALKWLWEVLQGPRDGLRWLACYGLPVVLKWLSDVLRTFQNKVKKIFLKPSKEKKKDAAAMSTQAVETAKTQAGSSAASGSAPPATTPGNPPAQPPQRDHPPSGDGPWVGAATLLAGALGKASYGFRPWVEIALLSILVAVGFTTYRWSTIQVTEWTDSVLFLERAINVGSGVSPFVPVIILSLVFALFVWCHARGIHLAVRYWDQKKSMFPDWLMMAKNRLESASEVDNSLKRLALEAPIRELLTSPWCLALILLAMVALLRLWQSAMPPIDSPAWFGTGWFWTFLIFAAVWFLGLTVLLDLCRVLLLWQASSRLLRAFATLPMSRAFNQIPRSFSRSFGRYLDKVRSTAELLAIPGQQLTIVAEGLPAVFSELKSLYRNRTSKDSASGTQAEARFEKIFNVITNLKEILGEDAFNKLTETERARRRAEIRQKAKEDIDRESDGQIDAEIRKSLGDGEFNKLTETERAQRRAEFRRKAKDDIERESDGQIDAEIRKSLGDGEFNKLTDTERAQRRAEFRRKAKNDIERESDGKIDSKIKEDLAEKAFKKFTKNETDELRKKSRLEAIGSVMLAHRDEVRPGPEQSGPRGAEKIGLGESETWNRLRNAALGCLELLEVYWETLPPAAAFVEPGSEESKKAGSSKEEKSDEEPASPASGLSKPARDWLRSAEDLLALQVVCAISRCTIPLSNLVIYLSVAPLLLLLTVSTYPVQPQRFLQVCYWVLLVAVLLGVIWVFVGRERDELLSRVSGTTPNAVTFDREFLGGVMALVTPIVALVLAQFPFFSDLLHQWFEPLGRILR
jgi:hypothetical protein